MLQFPQPQTPYHLSDHIQTQLLKERYRTDNSYYTEYTIKQKSTLHRLCDQTQEAKHITKIRLGTTVNINNERETERGKDRGNQKVGNRCGAKELETRKMRVKERERGGAETQRD